MSSASPQPLKVVIHCDLGPRIGVGHLMRCLALAEELQRQGDEVEFVADAQEVPLARGHLERRGLPWRSTPEGGLLAALDEGDRPDVVVVDSYLQPASLYADVRRRVPALLAVVDGDAAGREADVYLEQNFGAEDPGWPVPDGSIHLGGLSYALMRRDIADLRPDTPDRSSEGDPLEVLAFFGGTDAFGIAPVIVRAMVETGAPFRLQVVVTREELRRELEAVTPAAGQHVELIPPTEHLAELIVAHDVVLAAAGTTLWEVMCLGAAAGFIAVADNQREAYGEVIDAGLGEGIGMLEEVRADNTRAVEAIGRLLTDAPRRAELRRSAWQMVDGRGPERVVQVMREVTAGPRSG